MLIYGILTETSIGDLCIAGVIPGLLLTLFFMITVLVVVRLDPSSAPRVPATVDPIQLTLMIQAHHLDLDFYDAHMKPGAYLETHRHHFRDWHGGVDPRKRN